ncbi:hypothetical protein RRG08_006967 [Elysia crispata]|uniref:Uncharacterized protein n=1 Tax=Elysia crispata TaxID=231223 RepID=A0AAE0Z4B9_9GAST|nr:hypothetical protein RRG08_006967 [Elysia crispata]
MRCRSTDGNCLAPGRKGNKHAGLHSGTSCGTLGPLQRRGGRAAAPTFWVVLGGVGRYAEITTQYPPGYSLLSSEKRVKTTRGRLRPGAGCQLEDPVEDGGSRTRQLTSKQIFTNVAIQAACSNRVVGTFYSQNLQRLVVVEKIHPERRPHSCDTSNYGERGTALVYDGLTLYPTCGAGFFCMPQGNMSAPISKTSCLTV